MRREKAHSLYRRLGTAILLLLAGYHLALAQQDEYVDDPVNNRVQYEAPGETANYQEQISFGIYNYGFLDSVYSQYTGDSVYDEGSLPTTFFTGAKSDWKIPFTNSRVPLPCIVWDHLEAIDYDMPGGYSFGAEFLNFAATSEEYYTGEKDVVAPEVEMKMYLWSITLKLFLFNPFEKQILPYFGVAWGIINGRFKATDIEGKNKTTTRFFGPQNSRMIGVQLMMSRQWGGILELRSTTAFAKAGNDPFDQSANGDLEIDFSGSMVSATGYYRF